MSLQRQRTPQFVEFSRSLRSVDRGRVNQHDGDVILNRVNAAAFAAFQTRATRSESHWFLAERANQNVEKFLRDHTAYIVARSLILRAVYLPRSVESR